MNRRIYEVKEKNVINTGGDRRMCRGEKKREIVKKQLWKRLQNVLKKRERKTKKYLR